VIHRKLAVGFILVTSLFYSNFAVSEQYKLVANDGLAEDSFGYSVSIDGTTALVGAYKRDEKGVEDSGAAYVYVFSQNGWQLQDKLIANKPKDHDTLGGNVALRGDVAALGVIGRDDIGENAGAVYIFERNSGIWSQKQVLTAFDGKADDSFGQSIALTDNFLVIGAPNSNSPHSKTGAAYVYHRIDNSWKFHSKLTANDGAAGDLFGISVAINKDTLLVGADLNDEVAENAGAVYAYVLSNKQWVHQAKLTASDGANTDIFGVRVALSGDTALISARRDDIERVGVDAGSAYIFERHNGKWTQKQKLLAPDGNADDRFARGVALQNNTAIISAMHHDANGENTGALYVYTQSKGQWAFASKLIAPEGKPQDRYGWNVSLSGSRAMVAAPHRDDNGNNSGAVYVLDLKSN